MKTYRSACLASVLAPLILSGCTGEFQGMRPIFGTGDWNELSIGDDAYSLGKYHLAEGRHGLAVKYFQSAVTREPQSVEALNGLAATYDRMGRFDLAGLYYRKALVHNPKSAQTLNNLGYSYMLQGKYDLATAYLGDAVRAGIASPIVTANEKKAIASLEHPATERQITKVNAEPEGEILNEPTSTWVERTTAAIQTLVTRPAEIFLTSARDSGVDSRLASHNVARSTLPDKVPGPGFVPHPTIWTLLTADTSERDFKNAAVIFDDDDSEPSTLIPANFVVPVPPVSESIPEAVPVPAIYTAALKSPGTYVHEDRSVQIFDGAAREQNAGVTSDNNMISSFAQFVQEREGTSATETTPEEGPQDEPVYTAANSTSNITQASFQPPLPSDAEPTQSITAIYTEAFRLPDVVTNEDRVDLAPDEAAPEKNGTTKSAVNLISSIAQGLAPERMVESTKAVAPPGLRKWENLAIEVSNGTGRRRMAARFRGYLADRGVVALNLSNADHFGHMETTIYFRAGFREQALDLSAQFPVDIDLTQLNEQRAEIRIELGGDLLDFDRTALYPKEKPHEKLV